jgi:hypothetical protein
MAMLQNSQECLQNICTPYRLSTQILVECVHRFLSDVSIASKPPSLELCDSTNPARASNARSNCSRQKITSSGPFHSRIPPELFRMNLTNHL